MKNILAIEWLKIKRYRTFWVLLGLYLLLLPVWNYEVANGFIKMGGNGGMNFLSTAYSFPQVWGNLGFWGSVFILFMCILVIILTTNEYAYRTNRQNVIDGWTRMQFLHAKVGLTIVLSAAVTVHLFLLGLLFGAFNGGFSNFSSGIMQVGYFFLLSVNYLGFALLLSLLIKRSGLAIGLLLLYSLIGEHILKGIINAISNSSYGTLLPLQCSDELLPFPLMQMARGFMPMADSIASSTYVFASIGWCAIYYFAARALLSKNDW